MLTTQIEHTIRFSEVDPLGIVWHGHYIRFFEDGREAFGSQHGLAYMDIYSKGFVAPVVNVNCDYKKSLEYRDNIVIETTYISHPAAKIIFNYRILKAQTKELIASGTSIQVFLDSQNRQLQLVSPDFYEAWKKQQGL